MKNSSTMILDQTFLMGVAVLLLLLSIICQIIMGVIYQKMIKQVEQMATTNNRLLKQCKLKFMNCYRVGGGVVNVGVFVDKFLTRLKIGRLGMNTLRHFSLQMMLGSVLATGISICMAIIQGVTFGELIPQYLFSILGLYLYFSVASLVDLEGKQNSLRTGLIDYLENHMVHRLESNEEWKDLGEKLSGLEEQEAECAKEDVEAKELAALLREFLA